MNTSFKVGVGREIITPPLGTLLYGYPTERPAESVHDDLNVTAFAFESHNERVIIITADLCELGVDVADRIRNLVSEATGVGVNRIVFSATHTHSGPCTMNLAGWGETNGEYTEKILYPMTVKASVTAIRNMREAVMGVGCVDSDVGINRRERAVDGEILLGQNPWGVFNKEMTVLAFKDTDGNGICALVHYGAHGTSAGAGLEITRDWAGGMCDALEAECGVITAFISGPTGDTGPNLSNGKTVGDIRHTEELGKKAGLDAVRAYRSINEYKKPTLSVISDSVSLPFEPLMAYDEAKRLLSELGDVSTLTGRAKAASEKYRAVTEIYEKNQPYEKSLDFEVTAVAIGDVAFIPFPFEVFSEISMRIAQHSPFSHTLTVNNANGSLAYFPTKSEIPLGGYEVFMFKHFLTYDLVADSDSVAVREYLRILDSLFKK